MARANLTLAAQRGNALRSSVTGRIVSTLLFELEKAQMTVLLRPKLGSMLHDFPYASERRKCIHLWSINVTPTGLQHCRHACTFCCARDAIYADYGPQTVYSNLPELVEADLNRIDLCPPISISNTTDPCHGVAEVQRAVARLVCLIMSRGIPFLITTKGNPWFLVEDVPGFASYQRMAVATSIEGTNEVTRLLSPGAPSSEARLGFVKRLSRLGVKTSIRLDPVIPHVWQAIWPQNWLEQLEHLADQFADSGAKCVVSSTGRLEKRKPTIMGSQPQVSMLSRLEAIVRRLSPAAADAFIAEYCDGAETSRGVLLRRDLHLYHLCAQVPESLGAKRASDIPGEVDYAYSLQGLSHG